MEGRISDESRLEIKIGKIGISWQKIKNAIGALNIELIDKEGKNVNNMVEEKEGRSKARRKRGARELHNLKCSINYDKGRMENGLCSPS